MKLYLAMLFALSLAAMNPIHAADVKDTMEDSADARYGAAKDAAEQNYEAAKEKCESMTGNAKDVCMKDAKAEYVRAKSGAKVDKETGKEQAEATDEQLKAYYKAEKERCDALSGNAKETCINNAKMKYGQ